jgi:hypothetical protein
VKPARSYLLLSFLLLGIGGYSFREFPALITIILFWAAANFAAVGFMTMGRQNLTERSARWISRGAEWSEPVASLAMLPYFIFIRFSLLILSIFSREPISKITDGLFLGQALIWFHRRTFEEIGGTTYALSFTEDGLYF